MKVWRWHARDRSSLYDLDFLVACPAKSDLHAARIRLGLPKPYQDYYLLKPSAPEYDLAFSEPGHVFWKEFEDTEWQREPALEALRAQSTLRELHAGTLGAPVRRSNSD